MIIKYFYGCKIILTYFSQKIVVFFGNNFAKNDYKICLLNVMPFLKFRFLQRKDFSSGFLLFVRMAIRDFLRALFKGNTMLMNIPFPHEITACNNSAALLLKDTLVQMLHTALGTRTHTTNMPSRRLPCTPPCIRHASYIFAYECSLLIYFFFPRPKRFLMLPA